ncbi:hypothetical protein B0H34DRAFT_803851 [Crassisporium funariophilum]|nr:hypothetical protein B0H34DRAFT_803851 [Crassisporium funariophilum]
MMEASRPRPSILSLFDPLASTSLQERATSPDSDKENNIVDVSFFHLRGTPKNHALPRTLRRRLIDVGDVTMDDFSTHAMLTDEDELEQELNSSVAEDEDENETLTFRDMAKAATPKWSARNATMHTPNTSPTPRTPLAEISLKDETTPMARKKMYRRQIGPITSKLSQVEISTSTHDNSQPVTPSYDAINFTETPCQLYSSPPSIITHEVPGLKVTDDYEFQTTPEVSNCSEEALGSSVCTLNLPTPTGILLTETSIPVLILPSSPQSPSDAQSSQISPAQPRTRATLSPNTVSDKSNRLSVDLQSSFQLHLNSSETTFDLLNDKISFFSSRNGLDAFLENLEEDDSFNEKSLAVDIPKVAEASPPSTSKFGAAKDTISSTESTALTVSCFSSPDAGMNATASADIITNPDVKKVFSKDISPKAQSPASSPVHADFAAASAAIQSTSSTKNTYVKTHALQDVSSGASPHEGKSYKPLSTPSSSIEIPRNPVRPIPALRVVKRSKVLTHRNSSSTSAILPPAGQSIIATRDATSRRSSLRPLVLETSSTINRKESTSVNVEQVKPSGGTGPRRIAANAPSVNEKAPPSGKPAAQASTGLRQPQKYATMSSASAIPKPVAPRDHERFEVKSRTEIWPIIERLFIFLLYGSLRSMKFRRSRQVTPQEFTLKNISPSLLSDPAFSADPHSHPYFVTSHDPPWFSPPPLGHPVLKNKHRTHLATADGHITSADFHLIQPPNSPVSPIAFTGSKGLPHFSVPEPPSVLHNQLSTSKGIERLTAPSSQTHNSTSSSTLGAPELPTPPPPVEQIRKRMNFFSRRKSVQPSVPVKPKPVLISKKGQRRSEIIAPIPPHDVTEQFRPAAPRQASAPEVAQNVDRVVLPARSVTDGPPSGFTAPKRLAADGHSGRIQDLDKIDELDETNPWGIALHHGGPYEAAAQALKKGGSAMPSNNGSYQKFPFHANGKTYVPPQAPSGVSLNLSPGQILPHKFHAQYAQPSRMRNAVPYTDQNAPYPRYFPPASSHRQPPVNIVTPQIQIPRPSPRAPVQEQESDYAAPDSFHIGMAMLREESESSPRVFLSKDETPAEEEFNPYDPVHMGVAHPRTPSPLVDPPPVPPRPPIPHLNAEAPDPSVAASKPDSSRQVARAQTDFDPPPYASPIAEEQVHQPFHSHSPHLVQESQAHSRNPSPVPMLDGGLNPQIRRPDIRPSPYGFQNLSETTLVPSVNMQQPVAIAANQMPLPAPVDRDMLQGFPAQTSYQSQEQMHPMPASRSNDQRITPILPPQMQQPTQIKQQVPAAHLQRDRTQDMRHITPIQSVQQSREHLQPLPMNRNHERDGQSTHYSQSTHSSSLSQGGSKPPPFNRHLPKRLVMPTPLNASMPLPGNRVHYSNPSASANPQQMYLRPQPPPMQRSQLVSPPGHMQQTRAQDVRVAAGGKLRKRMSLMHTPSPEGPSPPVITTVSFAPPIIGFHHSAANEKVISRSQTEKIPKRLLSKRRTNL